MGRNFIFFSLVVFAGLFLGGVLGKEHEEILCSSRRQNTLSPLSEEAVGCRGLLPECPESGYQGDVPDEFDSRLKWPECPSLWEVRDQGLCCSCWAMAIASALTDRYCIKTGGKKHFYFSDQYILDNTGGTNEGCAGGSVCHTWQYWRNNTGRGIVSGGPYNSKQGCEPYRTPPNNITAVALGRRRGGKGDVDVTCGGKTSRVPEPRTTCSNDRYLKDLNQVEKQYVESACYFRYDRDPYNDTGSYDRFVESVQREILQNGPVVANIKLLKSFYEFNPSKRVFWDCSEYRAEEGGPGSHALKIIGWGTEKGVKIKETGLVADLDYWLVTNSFDYFWGERGTFKVFRGNGRDVDDLSGKIHEMITAGSPYI